MGVGCLGISTVYHLVQRGCTSACVLDRYPPPPCEAASTDISKIIHRDYNEPLYARLGIEFCCMADGARETGVLYISRETEEHLLQLIFEDYPRFDRPVQRGHYCRWHQT
jgi:hypothetical protein